MDYDGLSPLQSWMLAQSDPEIQQELERHMDFGDANAEPGSREHHMLVASSIIKEVDDLDKLHALRDNASLGLRMMMAEMIQDFFSVLTFDDAIEAILEIADDITKFRDHPELRPEHIQKAADVRDAFQTALEMYEIEQEVSA